MALPILETATFELTLPSKDVKVKFRPFLVKEEKILLQALESGSNTEMTSALKQIVHACTMGAIDINTLPIFDVEYIFLQIRAKSVGEVSTVNLRCPDDNETFVTTDIDLTEVEVVMSEGHNNKIELTDEMGMVMTYPTLESFLGVDATQINASNMIDIIAMCISQIYDKKGEEVHYAKDQTAKELIDFIEQLNTKQFKEVQKFFDTMPKLQHEITIKNPETNVESKVMLNGLNDFFA